MKIIVAYYSRYGQTERIADRIAAALRAKGAQAELCTIGRYNTDFRTFDAVIVAAPVYFSRFSKPVIRFMEGDSGTREFITRLEDYLRYVVPKYVAEGKSYLTIGIGCTGGRHRSVMIAERLRRVLKADGLRVRVRHRDIGRN